MTRIGQEALDYLRVGGREVRYSDGAAIVKRGQAGEAFYVVISGAIEVLLTSDDGAQLRLARLGEGESFGEMSLLTDEPVSADVVARSEATVLVCPADLFQTALAECGSLRNHILTQFCRALRETNSQAWRSFQRAEALNTLVRASGSTGPIIAESAQMRRVEKRISQLAGNRSAVLVTGQAGAGKQFAARKLHELAGDDEAPLIVVDCPGIEPGQAGKLLFGLVASRTFTNESSASGSLQMLGALDLADGGTLLLRHVDALDASSQETLGRYLKALADGASSVRPNVRIIATTCKDLPSLATAGRFDAALAEAFSAETLAMPPLLDRKRDILPLASLFLQERNPAGAEGAYRLNTSAEHALVSAQYRHRNVAELREAVEFAPVVADGLEIGSQHIFAGPKSEGSALEYDLSGNSVIRWLVDKAGLGVLKAATLVLFAAIIVACLTQGDTLVARFANGLVWGLWWPVLVIASLLLGRVWCTVCPISLVGRTARRLGRWDLAPPQWIKRHAAWLAALAFVLLVWVEHVFEMTSRPLATGFLLLALMGAAAVSCVLFQRELWCRYLCPLGALCASYSVGAMLHVRGNPNVCTTQCKTHECFKGSQDIPGCPVFHHPMYARDGHACKLCFNCLRNCPHDSAKLYLRPPLEGIWRLENLGASLAPFALVTFFMIMVMLVSHGQGPITAAVPYTALALLAAAAGAALFGLLRRLPAGEGEADPGVAGPVVFALLVLGAGLLLAFHLENIPHLKGMQIRALGESTQAGQAAIMEVNLLMVLQLSAILISAALAAIALWRIRVRLAKRDISLSPWRWRMVLGLCAVYLLAALAVTVWRGIQR